MITHLPEHRLRIAVIGSGIAGLSAAWLLSRQHDVTVYDRADYAGGHVNTVDAPTAEGATAVDTGFIVYNQRNYPNLSALFERLSVPTAPSDMSFAVSVNQGRFEYGATRLNMLFAQRRNIANPAFLRLLRDIGRFYRAGQAALETGPERLAGQSLGDFLSTLDTGPDLIGHHVLPMSAAIWSAPANRVLDFPALPFLRFMANHGLLGLGDRPAWRTVAGGGRTYVKALLDDMPARAPRLNTAVEAVTRTPDGVRVEDRQGGVAFYDQVVMACHADEALRIIRDPDTAERRVLGAFRFQRNLAVLHRDPAFMPRRRAAWASWNSLMGEGHQDRAPMVTYWMNRLQPLSTRDNLFVTLNPDPEAMPADVLRSFPYDHPLFDARTEAMQRMIWNLQGQRGLWFAGAWLGHGFHEDGIQAGLAVAEALGNVRRPWEVAEESARLNLPPNWPEMVRPARRAA